MTNDHHHHSLRPSHLIYQHFYASTHTFRRDPLFLTILLGKRLSIFGKVANTRLPVSERQLTDSFRKPTFSAHVFKGRRHHLANIRGFPTKISLLGNSEEAASSKSRGASGSSSLESYRAIDACWDTSRL